MTEEIRHYQVNGKYRVKFEKSASANKIDGFVVESNGDELDTTLVEAIKLYNSALAEVELRKPVVPVPAAKTPNGA